MHCSVYAGDAYVGWPKRVILFHRKRHPPKVHVPTRHTAIMYWLGENVHSFIHSFMVVGLGRGLLTYPWRACMTTSRDPTWIEMGNLNYRGIESYDVR